MLIDKNGNFIRNVFCSSDFPCVCQINIHNANRKAIPKTTYLSNSSQSKNIDTIREIQFKFSMGSIIDPMIHKILSLGLNKYCQGAKSNFNYLSESNINFKSLWPWVSLLP